MLALYRARVVRVACPCSPCTGHAWCVSRAYARLVHVWCVSRRMLALYRARVVCEETNRSCCRSLVCGWGWMGWWRWVLQIIIVWMGMGGFVALGGTQYLGARAQRASVYVRVHISIFLC